jgi:tetratricopeptide (TPR) repeat protein
MLDGLIDESGLEEEVEEEPRRPNVLMTLADRGVEFFSRLSPKEKAFLGSAVAVATIILSGGIYINRHNYGIGGDERFYQEGRAYQEEGDYDRATVAYTKVIKRYSDSPFTVDSYFRIAEIQRAREEYRDADRAIRQGLFLQQTRIGDPSGDWSAEELQKRWNGFFFAGEVNLAREEWDSAGEWFLKVVEETSESPLAQRARYGNADAVYNLAAHDRTETYNLRNAIEAYEAALDASPESENSPVAKLRLGRTWERLAGRETGFAEKHLKKSLTYFKDLQNLVDETSKAGIDPLDITLEVARLNRELGRIEESINSLRQVMALPRNEIEEGPLPHRVPFGLARSLLAHAENAIQEDNPNLAQQDLMEVLELVRDRNEHPFAPEEETESMYVKGHAYYQLGRMDVRTAGADETPYYPKMDATYQRALDLDGHFGRDGEDSLLASMRRTNYHFQINKDYKVSADSYQAILEEFPKNQYSYLARFRLAEALFHLEKYEEAEEQYRIVVEQFTSTQYTDDEAFRDSYFQLGYCQFLQKEYGQAAQTYKTLLELLDHEDSEEALQAWKRLAWAYYRQGFLDEAVTECSAFLAKYPDRDTDGKVRMSLGVALLRRFDYEDARKEFQIIIDEYPHSRNARDAHYQICQSYLSESKLALEQEKESLYQEALKVAKRIRETYNDDDRVLSIMGEIYFGLEDYTLARVYLEEYKNCARQRVIPADNLLHLAEACYRLEDYQNAAANFQQVAMGELPRGEAARALFLYGESLRLNKQLPKAIETYERMMEEFPTSPLRDMAEGRVEEVRWKMKWGVP